MSKTRNKFSKQKSHADVDPENFTLILLDRVNLRIMGVASTSQTRVLLLQDRPVKAIAKSISLLFFYCSNLSIAAMSHFLSSNILFFLSLSRNNLQKCHLRAVLCARKLCGTDQTRNCRQKKGKRQTFKHILKHLRFAAFENDLYSWVWFNCFLFDLVGSYNPDYGDTEGVQIIGKVKVYAMGFVLFQFLVELQRIRIFNNISTSLQHRACLRCVNCKEGVSLGLEYTGYPFCEACYYDTMNDARSIVYGQKQ